MVERLAQNGIPSALATRLREYWEPLLLIRADAPANGDELVEADEAFHLGLARAIENPYILEALEAINGRLRFVRRVVITTPHRIQGTAGEHLKILSALEKKNAEAARRALAQNINHARNKVEIALASVLANSQRKRA